MKVKQLIKYLESFDQNLDVVYCKYSEQTLLEKEEILVKELCRDARSDGWVHDARPDKPTKKYLVFPGN